MKENELNDWYNGLDFETLELITHYRQDDFSPEDGYQDFVDACDEWWNNLSLEEKEDTYNENA